MMPIGVPRVPYRTPQSGGWQWVDIWNCLVSLITAAAFLHSFSASLRSNVCKAGSNTCLGTSMATQHCLASAYIEGSVSLSAMCLLGGQ